MVTAIIIAAVAGFISLVSAGTSIGTILHFKKKFASFNEDNTKVDVENEKIEEKYIPNNSYNSRIDNDNDIEMLEMSPYTPHDNDSKSQLSLDNISLKPGKDHTNSSLVSKITEKQKIHIETREKHELFSSETTTETGRPNKVAETLSSGASHVLTAFTPQKPLQTLVGGINTGLSTIMDKHENPKEKVSSKKLPVEKSHTRHISIDSSPPKEDAEMISGTPELKRSIESPTKGGKKMPKTAELKRLTELKEDGKDGIPSFHKSNEMKEDSFSKQLGDNTRAKIGEVKKEALSSFSKSIYNNTKEDNINITTTTTQTNTTETNIQLLGAPSNQFSDEVLSSEN